MSDITLVLVEHDRGTLAAATLEALAAARSLGGTIEALSIGAAADPLTTELGPTAWRPFTRFTTNCSPTTAPRRGAKC